jgi:hypothetical protein
VAASPAAADSDDAGPAAAQSVALSTDGAAEEAPALEPTDEASAPQPAPPVTYWVTPGDQADDRTKLPRRVTWPMRALSAGLWIVAVSSVLIGPPH